MTRLQPGRDRWLWVLFLTLAQSPGVVAAVSEVQQGTIFNTTYLVQVLGSLLLVFGYLFGFVFLLKKMNRLPVSERKAIRVLSSVKVGSREKIMLVEAGEHQLLVGVAAGNIRTLYVFGDTADGAGDAASPGADFASPLHPSASSGGRR